MKEFEEYIKQASAEELLVDMTNCAAFAQKEYVTLPFAHLMVEPNRKFIYRAEIDFTDVFIAWVSNVHITRELFFNGKGFKSDKYVLLGKNVGLDRPQYMDTRNQLIFLFQGDVLRYNKGRTSTSFRYNFPEIKYGLHSPTILMWSPLPDLMTSKNLREDAEKFFNLVRSIK